MATNNSINTGSMTDGQLIIGSTGTIPTIAALTGTANQTVVTNGAGSITLSLPQNIATTSTPTFIGVNTANAKFVGSSTILTTSSWTDIVFTSVSATGITTASDKSFTVDSNGTYRVSFFAASTSTTYYLTLQIGTAANTNVIGECQSGNDSSVSPAASGSDKTISRAMMSITRIS